jgi:DNA polymerase III sliding clamp (beta) subunit (PCNA family)
MLATAKKKDVMFRFSEGRLTLAARDAGTGDSHDEIDIVGSVEMTLGFNGDEMQALLAHSGVDHVEIMLTDSTRKVAVIRPFAGADDLSLLAAVPVWGEMPS